MERSELEIQQVLEKEVNPVVKMATDLVIKTNDQSIEAQNLLVQIKAKRKFVKDFFADTVKMAHSLWKLELDKQDKVDAPLSDAEGILKDKLTAFIREEERKRQEEARIAEAKRQEAERKERERIEEQARKAREAGKTEKADALEEKAAAVVVEPTFVTPAPATKIQGVSISKVWKGECVDLFALCKAIADGSMPVSMVEPSTAAINAYAKTWKVVGVRNGIEIKEVSQMGVRA